MNNMIGNVKTLKSPIATAADDILSFLFFFFSVKKYLTYYVNRLLGLSEISSLFFP